MKPYSKYEVGPNDTRIITGNPIDTDFMVFDERIRDPERESILTGRDLGKGMTEYERMYGKMDNMPAGYVYNPNNVNNVNNVNTESMTMKPNNTSGPGTSFSFGTYDDNTKKLQGGLFDPDGFDYGAAFGSEPGKYVVTPNVPASMYDNRGDRPPPPAAGMPGGAKPDIESMTAEEAQQYIKSMAPTTSGITGDYSDLDTFKTYNFTDPNFQFEDFKKAGEIAGYGKENKLASDTNIISGAVEGTYRQEGDDPETPATGTGTPSDPGAPSDPSTPDTPASTTIVPPTTQVTPMQPTTVVNQLVPPGGIQTLMPSSPTPVTTPTTYKSTSLLQPVAPLTSEQLAGLGTDSQQQIQTLLDALKLYEGSKTTPAAATTTSETGITPIPQAMTLEQTRLPFPSTQERAAMKQNPDPSGRDMARMFGDPNVNKTEAELLEEQRQVYLKAGLVPPGEPGYDPEMNPYLPPVPKNYVPSADPFYTLPSDVDPVTGA